jgi:DNA-binding transcriptional LysR family regulator
MNLASLDLNLLVALDALVSEGHVGRAASRLGLSQPAASHALRRLRGLLHDPLLVRVGAGMELTPRALALRAPLAQMLGQVQELLVAERFEPSSSTRRFTLAMPDLVADLLLPLLIEQIGATAPGIRIDLAPWRGGAAMTAD